jgi:hypothetical protein
MRTEALTAWVAAVLVGAMAGCGGEAEKQPGSAAQGQPDLSKIDACALLQPAEIREATGADPGLGARPDVPEGSPPMCHWAPVQLLVAPAGWKTFEQFDSANRRTLEEAYDSANYQRLDGPGRFAVLLKDAGMIQAVGERHLVQVAAQPAQGRDTVEAVSRLAGLVLERLEQGAGAR